MSKDINKVMVKTVDEEHWRQIIDSSESRLIVVDIHQDWCGTCEAIHPTLGRVLMDYDNVEARLTLVSASIGKLGPFIQSSLPGDTHINLEKNGCLPLFALFRFKSCVSIISGVDGPLLLQQIAMNIPDKGAAKEE